MYGFSKKQKQHQPKHTKRSIQGQNALGFPTINQYSINRDLGEGSFAKVKLALQGEQDEKFAIKIINKSEMKKKMRPITDDNGMRRYISNYDYVEKELKIMKMVDHTNVLKMHEIIDDDENDNLYLVLDYAQNG